LFIMKERSYENKLGTGPIYLLTEVFEKGMTHQIISPKTSLRRQYRVVLVRQNCAKNNPLDYGTRNML